MKVGIGLKELFKAILLGFELAILIFEHADRSTRMDDQDLSMLPFLRACCACPPEPACPRLMLPESAHETKNVRGFKPVNDVRTCAAPPSNWRQSNTNTTTTLAKFQPQLNKVGHRLKHKRIKGCCWVEKLF